MFEARPRSICWVGRGRSLAAVAAQYSPLAGGKLLSSSSAFAPVGKALVTKDRRVGEVGFGVKTNKQQNLIIRYYYKNILRFGIKTTQGY